MGFRIGASVLNFVQQCHSIDYHNFNKYTHLECYKVDFLNYSMDFKVVRLFLRRAKWVSILYIL